MKLNVPRPSTVQPTYFVTDSDRSPAYLKKMSRSDITSSTFHPQTVSEALFQSVILHRSNSFAVSRPSVMENSWIEHRAESAVSLFPVLSVGRTCAICGGMLLEQVKASIQPCDHLYCKTCFVAYLEQRILDCEVRRIPCPTFECSTILSDDILKFHLSPELYDRYSQYRLNLDIESNPWVHHCPRPDCRGYDEGGLGKDKLRCNVCGLEYCFYCQEKWHEGKKCKQNSDKELDKWARQNGVRFCPNCRRRVEKTSGCDHMTCLKCRYDWCWECGEEYTSTHPDSCAVKLTKRRNPPFLFVLALLLTPLLLPFVFVLVALYYLETLRRDTSHKDEIPCLQTRWKSYPFLIFLTLLLTPLLWIIFFLLAGSILIFESRKLLQNRELGVEKQRRSWLLTAICVGISLSPVVILATFLAMALLQVLGVLFLIKKWYIWMRRWCDASYYQPKCAPGYLH